MSELITTLFSSFTEAIKGMGSGLKDAFMNVIYVDPSATNPVISDLAKFGFLTAGLAMAVGLVYGAIRLIRNR